MLSLLNSNLVFNVANSNLAETEEFISFIPQNVIDELGETILEDEISECLSQQYSHKAKTKNHTVGDYFYHADVGYTYLAKVIQNPKNIFYKLFSPAFEWDDEVNNFWNGGVYSIKERRWLKSRKTN